MITRTLRAALVVLGLALAHSAAAQEAPPFDAEAERAKKAANPMPLRRSLIERVLYAIEDDLLVERLLNAPRGVFVRLGGIGEGGGFGIGPSVRLNRPSFDVRGSAAISLKEYTIAEATLRVPGTLGHNEYLRPDGPYVEVYGRRRDAPQEDFFGLGSTSRASNRSSYTLRETLATVSAGIAKGNLNAGLMAGHLGASVTAGQDTRMPSSTDLFAAAELPGLTGHPRYTLVGPFLRLQTRDRAINKHDGGQYRAAWIWYADRSSSRLSFGRWDVDLRQYFRFTRETRTIALRAWSASASAGAGDTVPFYALPWVGGAQSVRGFRTFRFRDRAAILLQGEYRWRVNELMSGALFYDAGAVARSFDALGPLKRSYGVGLRIGSRMGSIVRFDVAFGGGEGRRILVRFDDAF